MWNPAIKYSSLKQESSLNWEPSKSPIEKTVIGGRRCCLVGRPTDGMKTGRYWRGGGEKQEDVGGVEERTKPRVHLRTFSTQRLRLVVHLLVPETEILLILKMFFMVFGKDHIEIKQALLLTMFLWIMFCLVKKGGIFNKGNKSFISEMITWAEKWHPMFCKCDCPFLWILFP